MARHEGRAHRRLERMWRTPKGLRPAGRASEESDDHLARPEAHAAALSGDPVRRASGARFTIESQRESRSDRGADRATIGSMRASLAEAGPRIKKLRNRQRVAWGLLEGRYGVARGQLRF